MAADKSRDRRVIRNQITGNHTVSHVLATMTLDRSRGLHVGREREQDQRDHHRRLVRRPAVTIRPISAIERRQIHPTHDVDHEPRQMILRQPLPHVRRQQKPLVTTTLNKVLRHTRIVLKEPDGNPFVRHPRFEGALKPELFARTRLSVAA